MNDYKRLSSGEMRDDFTKKQNKNIKIKIVHSEY